MAIRRRKTEILTSDICPPTSEIRRMGRSFEVRRKSENLPVIGYTLVGGPIPKKNMAKWEPLCSRELERIRIFDSYGIHRRIPIAIANRKS
jgi:hypothetical protein